MEFLDELQNDIPSRIFPVIKSHIAGEAMLLACVRGMPD
jgi:hypothetical protein